MTAPCKRIVNALFNTRDCSRINPLYHPKRPLTSRFRVKP
nr:MAG TPA: LydA-holin antagonist [Caudoviricetes sp.]